MHDCHKSTEEKREKEDISERFFVLFWVFFKWKLCSYHKHLILREPLDGSTRGQLEGVERLKPSAFPVFTSIILHCHDLHVYSTQQNCCYTNQTAFSTKACPPGSRQINRLSKHINEQIHPQRATRAVIQLKQD